MALCLIQCFFAFLLIFPVIFNFYLIPKIEKKLCVKLQYRLEVYKLQSFSRWFVKPFDVGLVIVAQYLILKLKGSPSKFWFNNPNNTLALASTQYDIRGASCAEIIVSFLVVLDVCLFLILSFLSFFLK